MFFLMNASLINVSIQTFWFIVLGSEVYWFERSFFDSRNHASLRLIIHLSVLQVQLVKANWWGLWDLLVF